jgi:hypothetical protein
MRYLSWLALLLYSCAAVKTTSVHELESGFYTARSGSLIKPVYARISADEIMLLPLEPGKKPGTAPWLTITRADIPADSLTQPLVLIRRSVDLDLTTVLLKFRFPQTVLPAQLNSHFNAALYAGLRKDWYHFRDHTDPLGRRVRKQTHREIDLGPFIGFGATAVNPSTTASRITEEYDGVVLQKGLALFIGSGQLTIGLGLGFDGLLSQHRRVWIYREKPWLGFLIGLNLAN